MNKPQSVKKKLTSSVKPVNAGKVIYVFIGKDGARYGHKGTCPYDNMLVQTLIDIVGS